MLTAASALWAQDSTKTDVRVLTAYADVKDHLTHDAVKGVKAELLWTADSTHADTIHSEYQEFEGEYKMSFMDFPIKQTGNYLIKV